MGNKATICRVLTCDTTNRASVAAQQAWMQVHNAIEAEIQAAEAAYQAGITQPPAVMPTFPLSMREIAGIAGQVLLDIRQSAEDQRFLEPVGPELAECVRVYIRKLKAEGIAAMTPADLATFATPVLRKLEIQPSPADMTAIGQALLRYVPIMAADMEKLASLDFSAPQLAAIAPPLPERKVTWEQLVEALVLDAGGVRHINGVGITEDRIKRYRQVIGEIQKSSGKSLPCELDVADARRFVQELQRSSKAIRSQQHRVSVMQKIFKIAIQYGYTDVNPFTSMAIRAPKGSEQGTYRSFTRDELITIFNHIKQKKTTEKSVVPLALLTTGARMSEITTLRHGDLKQTDAGIWYLDMKHDADGEFPHPLKTEHQNERHVPLHPALIQSGFIDLFKPSERGYIFAGSKEPSPWSEWFQKILIREGIYEKKITTAHSLRNTAIDAWRMAGITPEFRRAFTGHTSKDMQENTYGIGLKFMPDLLYKEMVKVDWSWIP